MTAHLRRAGSNLLWLGLSVALERTVFLLVTLYLARVLGAAGFGILAAAQALVLGLWLLADLGVSGYGVREVARRPERAGEVAAALLAARLVAALGVTAAWWVVTWLLGAGGAVARTGLGCSLYLPAAALGADWVCRGLDRFRWLVAGSVASALSFAALAVALVRRPEDLAVAAGAWAAAQAVGTAVLWLVLARHGIVLRPRLAPARWWPHLRKSVFFALSGGAGSLFSLLPLLLLGRAVGSVELGLFAGPYRVAQSLGKGIALTHGAIYPMLAEAFARGRDGFDRLLRRYRALSFGLGAATAVLGHRFAEPLTLVLLGRDYAGSGPVFRLLALATAVRLVRLGYDSALLATGRERLVTVLGVVGLGLLLTAHRLVDPAEAAAAMARALLVAELGLLAAAMAASAAWLRRGEAGAAPAPRSSP
jgi:O-antigen/teichoic acid export membrane protein